MSTKVLVLYYSTYGHIEQMAAAVAKGAASVPTKSPFVPFTNGVLLFPIPM